MKLLFHIHYHSCKHILSSMVQPQRAQMLWQRRREKNLGIGGMPIQIFALSWEADRFVWLNLEKSSLFKTHQKYESKGRNSRDEYIPLAAEENHNSSRGFQDLAVEFLSLNLQNWKVCVLHTVINSPLQNGPRRRREGTGWNQLQTISDI